MNTWTVSNELSVNGGSGMLIAANDTGNLIIRNTLAGNVPFDIDRQNPNNDIVENTCLTSNPPGLCTP